MSNAAQTVQMTTFTLSQEDRVLLQKVLDGGQYALTKDAFEAANSKLMALLNNPVHLSDADKKLIADVAVEMKIEMGKLAQGINSHTAAELGKAAQSINSHTATEMGRAAQGINSHTAEEIKKIAQRFDTLAENQKVMEDVYSAQLTEMGKLESIGAALGLAAKSQDKEERKAARAVANKALGLRPATNTGTVIAYISIGLAASATGAGLGLAVGRYSQSSTIRSLRARAEEAEAKVAGFEDGSIASSRAFGG